MKTLVLFGLTLLVVWAAHGQSTIRFSNREISPRINEPFYDADGTTRLDGPNYLAALYWAPSDGSEDQMVPVGPPQPFQSGTSAGYWVPANRTLPAPTPDAPV